MTPEKMLEKMTEQYSSYQAADTARRMLLVVLQAIDDGEVVEVGTSSNYDMIKIKPEYQKFLKGE